jgi:hypothetical protein
VFRCTLQDYTLFLSAIFVLHVFKVGHPAEAELYAARDEGEQFSEQFSNYIIKKQYYEAECTVPKNPIYVFPEMKLCGLIPNSYIHVSGSDLYIFPGPVCLFAAAQ